MKQCNQKLKLSAMDNEDTHRKGGTHAHRFNCIR